MLLTKKMGPNSGGIDYWVVEFELLIIGQQRVGEFLQLAGLVMLYLIYSINVKR